MKLIFHVSYLRGQFEGKIETKQIDAPKSFKELMAWLGSMMRQYIAGEIDFVVDSWDLSSPEQLRHSFWNK